MSLRDRTAWLILTFLGSGASPVAPGTAGSLAAAVVVGVLWGNGVDLPWLLPLLALAIAVLHLLVGERITPIFGRNDPGAVVSDEVCGLWLALSVPLAEEVPWEWSLLVGFGFFRLFDILKPPGVRHAERIPGKWGVLLDDVVAGVYAGIVLYGLAASGVLSALPRISS